MEYLINILISFIFGVLVYFTFDAKSVDVLQVSFMVYIFLTLTEEIRNIKNKR